MVRNRATNKKVFDYMSKLLILVGAPGTGKTYLAKSLISKVHVDASFIFDVNNEYNEKPYKKWYVDLDGDIDLFVERIKRLSDAVILIEDATGFLPVNGRNNAFVRCLQGRRHTNNTFILLFHSMQDLPKYVLRFCNVIYIFKTLDRPDYVKRTFEDVANRDGDLYSMWLKVYNDAKNHKFFSTYPPPKGIAPPSAKFSFY